MTRISKLFLTVTFAFGILPQLYAQVPEDLLPKLKEIKGKKLLEEITPQKDEKKGLWGYINPEGKYTIKPEFTGACPYEGHIARVSVLDQWGTIKANGLFGIWPQYEELEHFSASDSLAVAKFKGKYGLISSRGDIVLPFGYESYDYADYGYVMTKDGLHGTVSPQGKVILEPQFEEITMLDREKGLEHVRKNGKWGLLRDGKEILTIRWDEPITFLRKGGENQPDLYIARQNGKIGVVTIYGQYIVPAVYDAMELSGTGDYYITRRNGRYGAISLKMVELIAPILSEKPSMSERIFKVHDDGRFYCANINGVLEFDKTADIYNAFKPEEFKTTKSFPEWAKTSVIEQNLADRLEDLDRSRVVVERLTSYGFDVDAASMNSSIPKDVELCYPADWSERYGMNERGDFVRGSGTMPVVTETGEQPYNVLYKTPDFYLLGNTSSGDCIMRIDDCDIHLDSIVTAFNIKKFSGIYPREYVRVSDSEIMVRFTLVRQAADVGTSVMETNPYLLPIEPFAIKVQTSATGGRNESHALITFNIDERKAVSCRDLDCAGTSRIIASRFGGYYVCPSAGLAADQKSSLRKYDRNGSLDWEFFGGAGETFCDIEETENYVYLCGSTKSSGVETPMLIQLTKQGQRGRSYVKDYQNARFAGLVCDNYLMYVKTAFTKGTPAVGKDYYPMFIMEDMSDNVGVTHRCVWEPWDTGVIGGMGLVDENGVWLQTPMLATDQVCSAFDWEFSGFTSDFLIVSHMGKYGVIDREDRMMIAPKYDLLEPLGNPRFFKASLNGGLGVIDVDGRVIVPCEYDFVGNMSEDIIVVRKDGKFGCFDKTGAMIVPLDYEEIREFVGGRARALYQGLFGFIDNRGNFLVRPFYDEVENFSEGCALVTVQGNVGFVNLDGKWIANLVYQAGGNFSGGLAPLSQNGKYGYIDNTGTFVIPMQFSDAKEFNAEKGFACVAMEGRWGVINRHGTVILPMDFDLVEISPDGCFYVEKDGKCGIYSQRGKEIYPPVCESIERGPGGRIFKCGVANARLDGQRIRIDNQGNTIYQYSQIKEK